MGIFIGIIIVTLLIAGVGGGVYVLIFRAKHKKEMLANSQMGNTLPTYGMGPQQDQVQGMPGLGNMASPSQPQSPVMNDITGNGTQNNPISGMPQAPQAPAAPMQDGNLSFMPSQEAAPLNSDSPLTVPVAPANEAASTPSLDNTLDLNQFGAAQESTGNLLDDNDNVGPVSELASSSSDSATEVDISDSSVPVTKENDSLGGVESGLGDAAISTELPSSVQPEPVGVTEPSVSQEPMNVAEPMAAPEIPVSSPIQDFPPTDQPSEPQPAPNIPVPDPPIAPDNSMPMSGTSAISDFPPIPAADNTTQPANADDNGQGTGAQEMHI